MKTSTTIPGPLFPSLFQQQFFLGWTLELLQARWQPRWFFFFCNICPGFMTAKPMQFFKMLFCRDGVIPYIFSIKTTHQVSHKQLAGKSLFLGYLQSDCGKKLLPFSGNLPFFNLAIFLHRTSELSK